MIKINELDNFFGYINQVDNYIKFTQEGIKDNCLSFLDCSVRVDSDGKLHSTVYRKATHTDQYLLFESHHPLEHKLSVIRTLYHRADTIITDSTDRISEKEHVNKALSKCGYPKWAINTTVTPKTHNTTELGKPRAFVTFPYVKGLSENIQRICCNFGIKVAHKPITTLRQELVHPKDKQPKEQISGVVYGIHCEGENCKEYYIGETEQPIKKRMYQHRKAAGEGTSSAVFNHLHDKNHTFSNSNVDIISREKNWFERGVKEAVFVKSDNPSLNRHGGVRHKLSSAWDRNIATLARSRDQPRSRHSSQLH